MDNVPIAEGGAGAAADQCEVHSSSSARILSQSGAADTALDTAILARCCLSLDYLIFICIVCFYATDKLHDDRRELVEIFIIQTFKIGF